MKIIKEKKIFKLLVMLLLLGGILLRPIISKATNPTPEEYLTREIYPSYYGSYISGLKGEYMYLTDIEIVSHISDKDIYEVKGFSNYSNLKTVKINKGISSISGFQNCINLEKIEFPSTLGVIEKDSFSGCVSLKEVVIPKGVTYIKEGAFSNCDLNNLMLIVEKDSPAEQFAISSGFEKNKNYKYITYSLDDVEINSIPAKDYTGNSIKPTIIVKNIDKDGLLKENINYTVEYGENIKPGKGIIKVTGIENYTGTRTIEFDIKGKDFSKASVDGIDDCIYTGSEITPNIKIIFENKELNRGKDYNVVYYNNIKVGTATILINGIGEYQGTITKTFKINKLDISNAKVTGITSSIYKGEEIKISPTVKQSNITLKNETDYNISYKNNINTGKATIIITGKGNYKGNKTITFNIIPSQVNGLIIKSQKEKEISLQWSKNGGNVTGYKVYQYNSKTKEWKYLGKTKDTNYVIKNLTAGTTYKFRVKTYKSIDGKDYEGKQTELSATTQPSKTKIKKITTKNKKATIKWKKIYNATGYEIYMSKNKNKGYNKIKNITKKSTVKYTKKKLKKNKKYYFKVRTYRIVNGMKLYSSYSNIKSVKVKK